MIHPPRFSDITQRDLRLINRMTGRLQKTDDLDTLGRHFVEEMTAILPADCMLWNRWTPAVDEILGFETNDTAFRDGLVHYQESLNATIHHHPVIVAVGADSGWERPQRMSDYQSYRAFRSNPLFREVYRHLDCHHQIAYNVARLDDSILILSWNRRQKDFTDRDVQLLHLAGMRIASLSRRIEEKRRLDSIWQSLSASIASGSELETLPLLGEKDGQIMAALIRGQSRAEIAARLQWRRDTLDRHLAELRERAGCENMPQFLRAMAALKTHPPR